MTHPGVGPMTALAYVLSSGPERFARGKQIGTYVGMIPTEDSSAGKQRLGSRQVIDALLTGGGRASATRSIHIWRRRYMRLARGTGACQVAMGRGS